MARGLGKKLASANFYHARQKVESWGGRLSIESDVGKGSCVTIQLPKASPAEWFVPVIEVPERGTVVLVDSEKSVHQACGNRLDAVLKNFESIVNLYSPEQAQEWIASANQMPMPDLRLYLVGSEFQKYSVTGTELIQNAAISSNSFLVTSRFDEPQIRRECKKLGLKILPQCMINSVPVRLENSIRVWDYGMNGHPLV